MADEATQPVKRGRGRPRKVHAPVLAPQDAASLVAAPAGYVNPVTLHQQYLVQLQALLNAYGQKIAAGQMTDADMKSYTPLGQLFKELMKEERIRAKEEAAELDALSGEDLIRALAPMFIQLGWTPPADWSAISS